MTGPDPAVSAARSAVRRALSDLGSGQHVLVACSGGADSLALAAATAFVAPRAGLSAGAVVVDHGWHADSADVAERAAAQCRELGLDPVLVIAVQPAQHGGPEAAARDARYAALEECAQRAGASAVLLAHTRDDQAETVLLGLLRGSGARSLAGMPAVRGRYRRPFLDLSAQQVRQACAAVGLVAWQDPANEDPAYARSRLRAVLAGFSAELDDALGGDLATSLARTAALLAEDADALEGYARELLGAAAVGARPGDPDGCQLDAATLAGAPDAVRRRALLLAARRAGAPAGALGRRHVLAMDALVIAWRGQGAVSLPGGVAARRSCGRLLLVGSVNHGGRDDGQPNG